MNIFMVIKTLLSVTNKPYNFVLGYLSVPFRAFSKALILIQCLVVMSILDKVSHLISITLEGGQGRHCIPFFVTANSSTLNQ